MEAVRLEFHKEARRNALMESFALRGYAKAGLTYTGPSHVTRDALTATTQGRTSL